MIQFVGSGKFQLSKLCNDYQNIYMYVHICTYACAYFHTILKIAVMLNFEILFWSVQFNYLRII